MDRILPFSIEETHAPLKKNHSPFSDCPERRPAIVFSCQHVFRSHESEHMAVLAACTSTGSGRAIILIETAWSQI